MADPPDLRGAAVDRSTAIDLAREADFRMGSALVRPALCEVLSAGQTIALQPRVMQVLVALARADGEVVSRDDLLASCWGGLAIGDDAINRCIGRLRRLSEDEAPGAFTIGTLPRIGYRLTPAGGQARPSAPAPAAMKQRTWTRPAWAAAGLIAATCLGAGVWLALGRPGWPGVGQAVSGEPSMRSLAVLPIQNLTGDPSFDVPVDRLTEDVTYVLGRGGYLIVAPRNAAFAWKGKPVDERQIGRALNVRTIVIASLRESPPGYRVSYQIVDAVSGRVMDAGDRGWAASTDGSPPEGQMARARWRCRCSTSSRQRCGADGVVTNSRSPLTTATGRTCSREPRR
jgi:DNA-binding winged helix-turn-helix (wHTH) protein/TolB-like protein